MFIGGITFAPFSKQLGTIFFQYEKEILLQKQPLEVFCKIGVLKDFANFTGKHVLESLFNKIAALRACNFTKKRLQRRCFPMKFAKSLRTSFLQNTPSGYF